jgi:hypothetical protein
MPIEVLGVEHIDLTVNDVARSRAFYDKVLVELGFGSSTKTRMCAGATLTSPLRFGLPPTQNAERRLIAIERGSITSLSRFTRAMMLTRFIGS